MLGFPSLAMLVQCDDCTRVHRGRGRLAIGTLILTGKHEGGVVNKCNGVHCFQDNL